MASMRNGSKALAHAAASVIAMASIVATTNLAHAQTQSCSLSPKNYLYSVINPPPADRQEIMDLLHRFNWALDEGTLIPLDPLLADDATYELCNSATIQLEKRTGKQQLLLYFDQLSSEVAGYQSGTRHIESNTLLNVVNKDTVEGKSTVLVTIQFAGIETPALDYTGQLISKFRREIDPATNAPVWKIKALTLVTDGPKIVLRAR